jgi:hypothetical protein
MKIWIENRKFGKIFPLRMEVFVCIQLLFWFVCRTKTNWMYIVHIL